MFNKELRMCRKCERVVPEREMFSTWASRFSISKICIRCAKEVGYKAADFAMNEEARKYESNVTFQDLPSGKVTNPVPKPKK